MYIKRLIALPAVLGLLAVGAPAALAAGPPATTRTVTVIEASPPQPILAGITFFPPNPCVVATSTTSS